MCGSNLSRRAGLQPALDTSALPPCRAGSPDPAASRATSRFTSRPFAPHLSTLLLAALVLLPACAKKNATPNGSADAARNASADILRISQRNEPADLDPATASLPDEFFIIRALAEGLLVPSAD
ncbi:MAG TPA: hypothetical protein VEA63_13980, partial [Opitutus sp.]|nr:hypothetical protein [Opitutus sp.]